MVRKEKSVKWNLFMFLKKKVNENITNILTIKNKRRVKNYYHIKVPSRWCSSHAGSCGGWTDGQTHTHTCTEFVSELGL